MIEDNKKVLERRTSIYYPIQVKKNNVQVLFDLGSKVNAMTLVFVFKLSLKV